MLADQTNLASKVSVWKYKKF